jgi:hypothetical protein
MTRQDLGLVCTKWGEGTVHYYNGKKWTGGSVIYVLCGVVAVYEHDGAETIAQRHVGVNNKMCKNCLRAAAKLIDAPRLELVG